MSSRLRAGRVPAKVLAIVGVVGGAGLAIFLVSQLQQLRDQLAQSQQEVATLTSQSAALTQQLESFQASRKQLEERVASLRTQLTGASSELEQAHQNVSELQARYDRFEQERKDLQTQVSSLTGERDQLHTKLTALDQEKADLTRSVGHLRARLHLLNRDYQQLKVKLDGLQSHSSISVGDVNAATPPSIGSPAVVQGRVIDVNASHAFVIVDKGAADGVQTGMMFDIMRGVERVGRATVVRVHPQLAACDIDKTQTPGPLQVGDLAVPRAL